MSPHRMRQRILEGNPLKVLLVLSGPIIFNQLVQVLYNLVDTFWLGKLGRAAVSAPAVAWPVIMTVVFFGSGFTTAGLALISQYVGAGKWERVDRTIAQLLILSFGLALFFGTLGVLFAFPVLQLLGVPADVLPLATVYLQILSASFPFTFAGYVVGTALRAIGDTKTPTFVNVFTLTLNAVLDPLLIFGADMGVAGAALATAIANAVYSLVGLIILFKGWRHVHLRPNHFSPDFEMLEKIFRIGLPSALGSSFNGLGFTVVMALVAAFGSVATAAYGIGMRIINIISGTVFGVSQAGSIMIGQNVGAENYQRAKDVLHLVVRVNVAVTAVIAVFVYSFAPTIVRFFISDPAVISAGTQFIRIFAFTVPFFGVFFPVMFALRAAGKTKHSAALGVIRLWGMRIPFTYFFSKIYGLIGVWWGLALSNVGGAVVAVYFLLNAGWLRRIVE